MRMRSSRKNVYCACARNLDFREAWMRLHGGLNHWNGQRMSLQQGLPILQWNGLMETSPNWQLPILWSGVLPSSMSSYCLGTSSKMDRWMSLQRGFPILQKIKAFYAFLRGTEEGGLCPRTLNWM